VQKEKFDARANEHMLKDDRRGLHDLLVHPTDAKPRVYVDGRTVELPPSAMGVPADLDALVLSLNRMLGTTFVVISHELPSIFAIADRFIMLDRAAGTIIADGVPADLRDRATNEKVKAFMNRIPTATPTGSTA
jgi:ABC-type transporter Mla maintaining outer membrane lipid asymmetry ATPase subunit MlaF